MLNGEKMKNRRYKVLVTQGQGSCIAEKTVTLEEALIVADDIRESGAGSVAIKQPDGSFYDWKKRRSDG
jgi:hypothetical protein